MLQGARVRDDERDLCLVRPVPPRGCGGSVEHYYHFVFDLLWPLFKWIHHGRIAPSTLICLRREGFLMDRLGELLGREVLVLDDKPAVPMRTRRLRGLNPKRVPFTADEAEAFRRHLFDRLEVGERSERLVLLVERAPPDPYFLSSRARSKGSGASRRAIANHDALRRRLEALYGDRFRNLVLERMPLREQLETFRSAELVIGQHGAGLANALWVPSGAGTVVELSHRPLPHFDNLSRYNELGYRRYPTDRPHCHVDVEAFVDALRQWGLAD